MADKSTWEHFGSKNPYYGVATIDGFRGEELGDDVRAAFFESGETHVSEIWSEIERSFFPDFKPQNAVDYGCGVGRLAIPMAKRCGSVKGVDISSTMLTATDVNAKKAGLSNLKLENSERFMISGESDFDFVHAYIVLQHIDHAEGLRVIARLIDGLKPGGIGAIHVTYRDPAPRFAQIRAALYLKFPILFSLRNRFKKTALEPMMRMTVYDLNSVFGILQDKGCHRSLVRMTFHGFDGAMIIFQKSPGLLA
ncbi:MAG: class I SAM-dependent methyltransferase [Pyrinomonadaceae bacterium]